MRCLPDEVEKPFVHPGVVRHLRMERRDQEPTLPEQNRIAVERMRFNETAQAFNTKRMSFPTVMIAGFFGSRFNEKVYFKAQAGAETAPAVQF